MAVHLPKLPEGARYCPALFVFRLPKSISTSDFFCSNIRRDCSSYIPEFYQKPTFWIISFLIKPGCTAMYAKGEVG